MQLATLCYVRKNNQTLMLHRIKKAGDMHQGKWNGLGGKFHKGESPEECVIREVKEESGLTITNPKLKGFISFPEFSKNTDWHVFIFLVEDFTGQLIDSGEGVLEWIDNDCLFDLELWDGDKIFMKWLDQERFFSAKFIYREKRLLDYQVIFY